MAARFFVDQNDLALGKALAALHSGAVFPGHPDLAEVPRETLDDEWLHLVIDPESLLDGAVADPAASRSKSAATSTPRGTWTRDHLRGVDEGMVQRHTHCPALARKARECATSRLVKEQRGTVRRMQRTTEPSQHALWG